MVRSWLVGMMTVGLLIPAGLALGKGGGRPGGGGFGGFGPNGSMWGPAQPKAPVDPKVEAQKTREKAAKLVTDGFADLRVHDTAAALDAFSDAILLIPDDPMAHIGMGLAHAQKRHYESSEAEFTTAVTDAKRAKAKPDPDADPKTASPEALQADIRLANYDLGVTFFRLEAKPRALVLFDKLIADSKPTDEMMVNAQRSVLALVDQKARTSIAAMPDILKTLHAADAALASVHTPLRRWGITWMGDAEAAKYAAAGSLEPLPTDLPYLMPGDAVLPEQLDKDKKVVVLANPLLPVVAPDMQVATGPVAPADPTAVADPAVAPKVDPAPSDEPTAPAVPVAPAPPVVADATPAAPVTRTVNGAAFAVAPDLLLTCGRLTSGAKSITIQATDGVTYPATLVDTDEATGIALIKVEGGHFVPMALADSATSGSVHVPAFIRPGVFGPQLDLLNGTLAIGSTPFLHTSTHPRSAGSPLMNAQGKVVGILVASRDDPLARLPVVTVDLIRKFGTGKFTFAAETAAAGPSDCVFELAATREE